MNRNHILRSFCLKLQAAESMLNGNVEQTETAQVKKFLEIINTLARYQITFILLDVLQKYYNFPNAYTLPNASS